MMRQRTRLTLAAVVTVAGLSAATVVLVRWGGGHSAAATPLPTPVLPAVPAPTPHILVLANGKRLTCPFGTTPEVMISDARFSPDLIGATTLHPGRYQLGMSGQIANDTDAAITVSGVSVSVQGRPAQLRLTAPGQIPAHGSVPMVLEGPFTSTRTERADIKTQLTWQWTDHGLRPCGEEGLIEDD
jgi:hypothetical protein